MAALAGSPVSLALVRQYDDAKRIGAKWPLRWTRMTASNSSSDMLKLILSRRMPALQMSTSMPPKVSMACWTIDSPPAQLEQSS